MAGIQSRTFESPDQVLPIERGSMEMIEVDGVRAWRLNFEPGWRYTEHVDSDRCPAPHAAYVVSGRLAVEMDDGTTAEVGPDSVVVIDPGHDAWTVGDEPCVLIDFAQSVTKYAEA